jgi:ketosteroid isomerase-like protein
VATHLGERLALAIAARDAAALTALLAPDVSFRALTPGKFWEADDAGVVVDDMILGKWFSPERSITAILGVDCNTVGAVDHVAYRFRARRPDGDFLMEQQAYLTTENGRINWLQILCSGYVPDE